MWQILFFIVREFFSKYFQLLYNLKWKENFNYSGSNDYIVYMFSINLLVVDLLLGSPRFHLIVTFPALGYVCSRTDVLSTGCCNTENENTKQYSCETCKENACCSIYEYCISCCLHPDKVYFSVLSLYNLPAISQFDKVDIVFLIWSLNFL